MQQLLIKRLAFLFCAVLLFLAVVLQIVSMASPHWASANSGISFLPGLSGQINVGINGVLSATALGLSATINTWTGSCSVNGITEPDCVFGCTSLDAGPAFNVCCAYGPAAFALLLLASILLFVALILSLVGVCKPERDQKSLFILIIVAGCFLILGDAVGIAMVDGPVKQLDSSAKLSSSASLSIAGTVLAGIAICLIGAPWIIASRSDDGAPLQSKV